MSLKETLVEDSHIHPVDSSDSLEFVANNNSNDLNSELDSFKYGKSLLINDECIKWLGNQKDCSFEAVVTDPPYSMVEYSEKEQSKLRSGNKGGIWRLPPSFDGKTRAPLPRFSILKDKDINLLVDFFSTWSSVLFEKLVPGAHVIVASNPLLSHWVAHAIAGSGFENRGIIIRLVQTMRGGDRPKYGHEKFVNVSVMPKSMWEPWLLFRKPVEGKVIDNLGKWKTGGLRRPEDGKPFGDVILSGRTSKRERKLAAHPSLKPQMFLRQLVRASLPLGEGVVLDPFAGSGSTLAACEHIGYQSIGIERDSAYFKLAKEAIPNLAKLKTR